MKNKLIMIICAFCIFGVGSLILVNKHDTNNVGQSINNDTNNNNKENRPFSINAGSINDENQIYKDTLVTDYDKYLEILSHYEMQSDLDREDFDNYDYLSIVVENDNCGSSIEAISDLSIKGNKVNVVADIKASCTPCAPEYELYFIRLKKGVLKDNYDVKIDYNVTNQVDCDIP